MNGMVDAHPILQYTPDVTPQRKTKPSKAGVLAGLVLTIIFGGAIISIVAGAVPDDPNIRVIVLASSIIGIACVLYWFYKNCVPH